jgi:hypothetical protein
MVGNNTELEYPPELETEIKTYFEKRSAYLNDAKGKYILIKGEDVIGVFDSYLDALKTGYEKYGNVAFLVKQILEIEPELKFTANILGI